MRDDIHTNAPVPPKWRRFIKACTSEAEGDAERLRRLEDAMRVELVPVRDMLPALEAGLQEQASRLPGVRDLDDLRSLARTPAQEIAVGHAIRLAQDKGPAGVRTSDVVDCTTGELLARRFRATEGYLCQEHPTQRPELMKRMHTCQQGLNKGELVRSTVQGKLSARPSRPPTLNLDEGLPLGPKGKK